jgi:hypothetical protein
MLPALTVVEGQFPIFTNERVHLKTRDDDSKALVQVYSTNTVTFTTSPLAQLLDFVTVGPVPELLSMICQLNVGTPSVGPDVALAGQFTLGGLDGKPDAAMVASRFLVTVNENVVGAPPVTVGSLKANAGVDTITETPTTAAPPAPSFFSASLRSMSSGPLFRNRRERRRYRRRLRPGSSVGERANC